MNIHHHSFRHTLAGFLLLTTCALGYNVATAQPGQEGQGSQSRPHHSMLERLTTELSLTSEQQAALKPILDKMRPPGPPPGQSSSGKSDRPSPPPDDTSGTNSTGNRPPRGGGGNRAALDAKMKEILTPEQLAKWEQIKARHRPPGSPPGGASKQEQ